jgi:sugar phosphate isomerase/epimerase
MTVGLDRLSLNQATVRRLGVADAVALCVRHDIPAIGLWREPVAEAGLAAAAAAVRAAGLHVSSLCRGGFFTRADADGRRAALADNRAAIAEAAELGADTLALVCGGLIPGHRDLGLARRVVADAIGDLVPDARRLGVRLGIEALHPMFCADRSVICSLGEAVDLASTFPPDVVGVMIDTYHVWWDARLRGEIARAGERIVGYQVSDWLLPLPEDILLGRGHLGDGLIDFGPISAAVTAAGYEGYVEVEIFNAAIWDAPPDHTAAVIRERWPEVTRWAGPLRLLRWIGASRWIQCTIVHPFHRKARINRHNSGGISVIQGAYPSKGVKRVMAGAAVVANAGFGRG